jgi:hypothetical protein
MYHHLIIYVSQNQQDTQWRTQLKNGGRENFDHKILDKEQQHDYQEQSGRTTNKNQNVIF